MTAVTEIRRLEGHGEFAEAVRLQKIIWQFEDVDVLPVRLFVTAEKVGGQILGAFDGDEMIGFCLAIPGLKAGGRAYLHSHMLGVLEDYRDRGAGRQLKLYQREDALAREFDLIEWTFDPLELKNAYFNIERLGAVVRRYVLNQYGNTSSPLHGGLPTDRCVAEWWIRSARVEAALGTPGLTAGAGRMNGARVEVPADIAAIKQSDPARAREIQARVSETFLEYFEQDLTVTGFERSPDTGTYLFDRS